MSGRDENPTIVNNYQYGHRYRRRCIECGSQTETNLCRFIGHDVYEYMCLECNYYVEFVVRDNRELPLPLQREDIVRPSISVGSKEGQAILRDKGWVRLR